MYRYGHNTHHPSTVVDLYSTHKLHIHIYAFMYIDGILAFLPPKLIWATGKMSIGRWLRTHLLPWDVTPPLVA